MFLSGEPANILEDIANNTTNARTTARTGVADNSWQTSSSSFASSAFKNVLFGFGNRISTKTMKLVQKNVAKTAEPASGDVKPVLAKSLKTSHERLETTLPMREVQEPFLSPLYFVSEKPPSRHTSLTSPGLSTIQEENASVAPLSNPSTVPPLEIVNTITTASTEPLREIAKPPSKAPGTNESQYTQSHFFSDSERTVSPTEGHENDSASSTASVANSHSTTMFAVKKPYNGFVYPDNSNDNGILTLNETPRDDISHEEHLERLSLPESMHQSSDIKTLKLSQIRTPSLQSSSNSTFSDDTSESQVFSHYLYPNSIIGPITKNKDRDRSIVRQGTVTTRSLKIPSEGGGCIILRSQRGSFCDEENDPGEIIAAETRMEDFKEQISQLKTLDQEESDEIDPIAARKKILMSGGLFTVAQYEENGSASGYSSSQSSRNSELDQELIHRPQMTYAHSSPSKVTHLELPSRKDLRVSQDPGVLTTTKNMDHHSFLEDYEQEAQIQEKPSSAPPSLEHPLTVTNRTPQLPRPLTPPVAQLPYIREHHNSLENSIEPLQMVDAEIALTDVTIRHLSMKVPVSIAPRRLAERRLISEKDGRRSIPPPFTASLQHPPVRRNGDGPIASSNAAPSQDLSQPRVLDLHSVAQPQLPENPIHQGHLEEQKTLGQSCHTSASSAIIIKPPAPWKQRTLIEQEPRALQTPSQLFVIPVFPASITVEANPYPFLSETPMTTLLQPKKSKTKIPTISRYSSLSKDWPMVDIPLDDVSDSQSQPCLVGTKIKGNQHSNKALSQPKSHRTLNLQLSDRIILFPSKSTSKEDFTLLLSHQPPKENSISTTELNNEPPNQQLYSDMSTTDWLRNKYYTIPQSASQIPILNHAALNESYLVNSARRQSVLLAAARNKQRQTSHFHLNDTLFPSLATTTTTTTNHSILHSPFFHFAFLLFLLGALSSIGVSIPLIQAAARGHGEWKMENPILLAIVITGGAFAVGCLWLLVLAVEYRLIGTGWARRLGGKDWYGGKEIYWPRSWAGLSEFGEERGDEEGLVGLRDDVESRTFYRIGMAERGFGDVPAYVMPNSPRGNSSEELMYSNIEESGNLNMILLETLDPPPTRSITAHSRFSSTNPTSFRVPRYHTTRMEEIEKDTLGKNTLGKDTLGKDTLGKDTLGKDGRVRREDTELFAIGEEE